MNSKSLVRKALTIAGSDSGGGAGIQADLKTFQELGVYGMSVITAVTAQNTVGVQGVFPLSVEGVERQLQSIGEDLRPDAVKTGMLLNVDIIRATGSAIRSFDWENVVVDPVMLAKGGAALLEREAVKALKDVLLPMAAMVTPNLPEAEVLAEMKIIDASTRKEAARRIYAYGPRYVLIKGGHEEGSSHVIDLLYDGSVFTEFVAMRLPSKNTHGTGCTMASAIAAGLAQGKPMQEAVHIAKCYVRAGIAESLGIGAGIGPISHWAYKQRLERDSGAAADVLQVHIEVREAF